LQVLFTESRVLKLADFGGCALSFGSASAWVADSGGWLWLLCPVLCQLADFVGWAFSSPGASVEPLWVWVDDAKAPCPAQAEPVVLAV